ncbi:MAG: pyridoxal phosphate-dependent aminotransferase [Bacillota bacterium]|nr:pyridoxal phosphate-dependent aminotransferase [Bacillota bacterium]MDD3299040.1 pyridoxal phosphate-dependent aminotransferase [Bacillota bacterium]MDD3851724.1 pyridoxal phosphate-dependent aminotransferase [Bacillota bacterium]MDD4708352.1 pyridoxal phosphate-dependent aminotransferase [Bacillota bacterium]
MKTNITSTVQAVPHSRIRRMFNIASSMDNVINLGIGEPDFTTPVNIIEAAKKAMDSGFTHYTANAGLPELRECIANKLKRDNDLEVYPDTDIIVTSGGMGALALAILTLAEKGDEVLLSDPSWCNYTSQIILAGAKPIFVPVKEESGFMLRAEDIEKRITDKTKLLIINSPGNPTGAVISKEEMDKISGLIERTGIYVITDEVYEKLVYEGARHISLASYKAIRDKVITVNSFSKSYAMTGWRVGFAAGNKEIIGQMIKLQEHMVACVSTVSQKAAIEALKGPQDALKSMLDSYSRRRSQMLEKLNSIGGIRCKKPMGSFYIFANIKALGKSSEEFALGLLTNKGVCLIPGTAFGEHGEGFVRISYATSEENILEGMDRLKDYIEESIDNLPQLL